MKTITVMAAGALVALTGMAASQTVSRGERRIDVAPRIEGLASVGDVASLASLASLADIAAIPASLGDDVSGAPLEIVPRAPWAPGDPADSLYRAALDELGKANYRRAAEMFARIADRYPESAYASESMYYQAFALYRSGRSEDLNSAIGVLASLSERYPSSSKRGDASTLRTRVCGELAQRGDERCAAEVARIADATAKSSGGARSAQSAQCPTGDEDDDRVAALNALLQMDSERAVPILEKVLARRDACSAALRRKAVFLLSQKRGADVADALMRVAQNDPDAEVRSQAVFWLGQTGSDKAIDLLSQILASSKEAELKEKALFALSQHSGARAGQMLRDIAGRESEPEEIRDKAIFWLGQRNSEDNAAFLRQLYGRMKNESLKEKILFSLSQQRGAGNERWLMDVALDANESVEMRKKALFWIGQSGGSIGDLVALWSRMDNPEMREQLIFVYSQRHEREAVDKLMDIAKNEKDRELRKKAIFWLSQSRDPRVAKFLEELIS